MHDGGHRPTTVEWVVPDGTEIIVAHVDARAPDLGLVETLARLRLLARRCGCGVRLHDAPEELRALLELVGLLDVLPLELRRQAEGGEELGIEEVMQADDPLA